MFFRFAYLYTGRAAEYLTVYILLLTLGVLIIDNLIGKTKIPGKYKQVLLLLYLMIVITAGAFFVVIIGGGEPHVYLINYYFVLGILYTSLLYSINLAVEPGKLSLVFIVSALLLGAIHVLANAFIFTSVIFLLYFFRYNLKNLIPFIAAAVLSALVVQGLFLDNGSSFLSLTGAPLTTVPNVWKTIILLISVYVGWSVRDIREVYISGASVLFLLTLISILLLLLSAGFHQALNIGEPFTAVLIPFCLFAIHNYKVDRFLGKVIPADSRD